MNEALPDTDPSSPIVQSDFFAGATDMARLVRGKD